VVAGSTADLQVRRGHVPRIVPELRPSGRVQSTRRLDLAIGLPLRHREALEALLEDLYDPSSPRYHQFLTPQQFAEQFCPTEQEYRAVISFAESNHFVLKGAHANRMLVDVNATAGEIERAFHVRLQTYQHTSEARQFYSPDVDPSVDPAIPVLSIAGLENYYTPRPVDFATRFHQKTLQPATGPTPAALDATGTGPAGTFMGNDFRNAYAPGLSLNGSGQSIGLVEFDSYYSSDIRDYEDLAGLPQVTLSNILVNGFNRLPGQNNGEVALDIQMAISMAPGLSNVMVYEGTNPNDILNRMATDNLARQLSCSWSFGSPTDATRQQIFQQFAAQGQ